MTPVRLQLRRAKGFRLQEASRAINGLPCVKVDRTTRWGNQFSIVVLGDRFGITRWPDELNRGHDSRQDATVVATLPLARAEAVRRYREWLTGEWGEFKRLDLQRNLVGKNLACFCPLDEPCHADVLLELANAEPAVKRHLETEM